MGDRYVSAWDMGRRDMGAHWVREGSRGSKNDSLDARMEMDHVIYVDGDGLVSDARDVHAPEVNTDHLDDDAGSVLKEHEATMVEDVRRQGWELESGWTGQYSYNGVGMHASEFIGGGLAEHILTTPGYWVACLVMLADGDGDADSWVVAHRELEHPDDCLFCAGGQEAWEHEYRSCKGSGCEHGEVSE